MSVKTSAVAWRREMIERLLDHPRVTFCRGSSLTSTCSRRPSRRGQHLPPGGDLLGALNGRESCRGINDFMPVHMLHLIDSALAQVFKGL